MTRSARHAALGACIALVACNVYDPSLLTGGVGGAGNVPAVGGSGPSSGGTGVTSGRGGMTAGGAPNGGRGASGGSGATGGTTPGGAGGTKGGAGGTGSGATGGSTTSGGTDSSGTGGDATGGTGNSDSSGGMGDDAGAGQGDGGTNAGGTGGSGAGAGAGTGGSAGGPPVTAAGCAKLSAVLAASTDKTHYLITLGSADVDFTNAVVAVHLYAVGADGGIFAYLQQSTFEFFGLPVVPFSTFSGWTTLTWDLSTVTATSPVDKAKVRRLGLEINGVGGTNFVNPTLVYVDAITVTTPTLSFSFDAASSVNTTPASSHSGDTALWQNSASADTTATGSTLEWVASCP